MIEFDIRPTSHLVPTERRDAVLAAPGFGRVFTDHMITLRWSSASGWHDGCLEPYAPFVLDPATAVFHYGQALFEGMKAYRQADGLITLFRPEANAARFNKSAQRMAMPELPADAFVRALELLVAQDCGWVPATVGSSLYLRPFMIATQSELGFTHPSSDYLFCVIASPAAPYFGDSALKALTVWLSEEYTRAAPGGTGAAKVGGNYGAAFAASREATARGCDQVVWLDAAEHFWVEEMGGMNLFFVYGPEAQPRILTPELTGTLLPGVTRDSLLRLAPELGISASDGRMSTSQWKQDCAAGKMTEVFACGTAAVLAPVGHVRGHAAEWLVGNGAPGPVTLRLRKQLLDIQYGLRADPFGWVHKVC